MGKKEMTKAPENALAMNDQLAEFAGAGFEEMGATDVAIPFITILQDLSPQVKRGNKHVEGAESGMLYNNVTGQLYDSEKGVTVIPCGFQKRQVEWKPRESGGGFVKQHNDPKLIDTCTRDSNGKFILPNGNTLVETAYHFCLMLNPETNQFEHVVFGFASSNLNPSRKWNYMMRRKKITKSDGTTVPAPMFAYTYTINTELKEKAGNTYFVFNVESGDAVSDPDTLRLAYDFYKSILGGSVEVAGEDKVDDDDLPF